MIEQLTVEEEDSLERFSEEDASEEHFTEMEKLAFGHRLPSMEENFNQFSSHELSRSYEDKWGRFSGIAFNLSFSLTLFAEGVAAGLLDLGSYFPDVPLYAAIATSSLATGYASEKALETADERRESKKEEVEQYRERLYRTHVVDADLSDFLSNQDEVIVEGKDWIELCYGEEAADLYQVWDCFEKIQLFEDLRISHDVLNYQLEVRLPSRDRKMIFYGQDQANIYDMSLTRIYEGARHVDTELYEEIRELMIE